MEIIINLDVMMVAKPKCLKYTRYQSSQAAGVSNFLSIMYTPDDYIIRFEFKKNTKKKMDQHWLESN